jgi:tetratricopeptide (TPR) repeat protein
MESIAAICGRVVGLPLAIELAAARTAQLKVGEILAGLDQQRLAMRHRDRNVPDRQRTMRALLDWSWHLLTPDEQDGLAAIGVFAASFDLTTATVTMATEPATAAETMLSLVDKSLVEVDLTATRYRCLHSIRTYSREHLEAQDAANVVADRLARHFLERFGPQLDWLDLDQLHERSTEIDNVRGLIALLGHVDQHTSQALACIVLEQAGLTSGRLDEGLAYVASLPSKSTHRIALLAGCATQALNGGDTKVARTLLDEAIALRLELGTEAPWDELRIEHLLGLVSLIEGDPQAAMEIAEGALDVVTSPRARARLFSLHAAASIELGDDVQARESSRKSLAGRRVAGSIEDVMIDYCNLAETAMRCDDLADASQQQTLALTIAQQLGSELVVAFSAIIAARLAATAERWTEATHLCAHASATLRRNNTPLYPSDQAITDLLLENAKHALGPDAFAQHCAEGESSDMSDAIILTESILAEFASR